MAANYPTWLTASYSVDQPPQGLVVDTDVISPLYPNFYLQSHAGNLGSESPVPAVTERMMPTLVISEEVVPLHDPPQRERKVRC